ncbi:MAG: hypothetical protein HYZ37_10420 [Candidatus Solibacter usitatus]|nr:hypothetical protein [Candidatus Solibacter usitatus]
MSPLFRVAWMLLMIAACSGQTTHKDPLKRDRDESVRLPNGKLQSEEILKADYERNLKDAAELVKLSHELKDDLEKSNRHILSVAMVKKAEEIEKVTKRIRSRLVK